jgi:hypothetical protein
MCSYLSTSEQVAEFQNGDVFKLRSNQGEKQYIKTVKGGKKTVL